MTYAVKTPLWPHQRAARDFALNGTPATGCALLAMEMRTGKTLTTLALMAERQVARALVIAPGVPAKEWHRQLPLHLDGDFPEPVLLHRGGVAERIAHLRERWTGTKGRLVAIVNYEALTRMPELLRCDWPLVVYDECHRVKGPTSKISKYAREKLRARAGMRMGLSGTPLPQGLIDAYGVYSAIHRDVFSIDYWTHFKHRYAIPHPRIRHAIADWRDKDALQAAMARWTTSCRMADVLPDYMAPADEWLMVELEPRTTTSYVALERDMLAAVDAGTITAANALVKALRLQQLASGIAAIDGRETATRISSEKLNALTGLLEDVAQDEPVVVFAVFTPDLDAMADVAKKLGRPLFFVRGGRDEEREFHESAARGEGPIIALQIQAGSEGIDLSESRYCVFLSTGYSSARYRQARARLQGAAQKRHVTFWHIGATGTIDTDIADALARKREFEDALLERMRITCRTS